MIASLKISLDPATLAQAPIAAGHQPDFWSSLRPLRDKVFLTCPQAALDSPHMRKLRKRTYGTAKIRSERGKSAPERRSVEHALACSGDLHPGWPFVIDTSPGEPPATNPSR